MKITACKGKVVVTVPKPSEEERYSYSVADARLGVIYSVGTDCDPALSEKINRKLSFGANFAEIPTTSEHFFFLVMNEANAHAIIED